jgi:hypothetical protein
MRVQKTRLRTTTNAEDNTNLPTSQFLLIAMPNIKTLYLSTTAEPRRTTCRHETPPLTSVPEGFPDPTL